jgi:predicted transcriptional regulator
MKAVMLSVQQKWCGLIASGKKTIEVRKTKPRLSTPFKCYIYCTKGETIYLPRDIFGDNALNGKVIGEFVCDRIRVENEVADQLVDVGLMRHSCLSSEELLRYADGKALYSWHISDLKIYDEPKPLCEFEHPPYLDCDIPCRLCKYGFVVYGAFGAEYDCDRKLKRPPQSWCYVEAV